MKSIVLFVSFLALSTPVWADPVTANLENGVILKGYDPVSYFTSKTPAKGKAEIQSHFNGITYFFSTLENKKIFDENPKKFQPEYEGWCATAVAGGYKYDIDPENYKITDGRLFLFYKGWKGDAKKSWIQHETESIKKADTNWPHVKGTKE